MVYCLVAVLFYYCCYNDSSR